MVEIVFPFNCAVIQQKLRIETPITQKLNAVSFKLPFLLKFNLDNAQTNVINDNSGFIYVIKFDKMCYVRSFMEEQVLMVKENFGDDVLEDLQKECYEKMLESNNTKNKKHKRMMVDEDGWTTYK